MPGTPHPRGQRQTIYNQSSSPIGVFLTAFIFSVLCATLKVSPPSDVVPGVGVGQVKLGMDISDVERIWGKPSNEDGALGRKVVSWSDPEGKDLFARILFVRNQAGDSYVAEQIGVFGPDTTTPSGIKIGSDAVGKELAPNAKTKILSWAGQRVAIDAESAGLAIEIESLEKRVCRAIIVHRKDVAVSPMTGLK